MFTLDDPKLMKKTFAVSLFFSVFFVIFTLVYYRFSHEVYSDYMTYLGLIPFVMAAIPSYIFMWRKLPLPGYFSYHIYFSGVAAITMASALKGIFDIAGNASVYQTYLMYFGLVAAASGCFLFLLSRIIRRDI